MNLLIALVGLLLIVMVLWEAFETIVLPRQVTRPYRLTRVIYKLLWGTWAALGRQMTRKRRERFLSFFGPISLILLLSVWAVALVFGFACLHYAGHTVGTTDNLERFGMSLYYSGTTMFTLGLGDLSPHTPLARFLTVTQSFLGFGFLAIVVGYFPVLYQSFSRREAQISLLDARSGSPPSATELLRRHNGPHGYDDIYDMLRDYEGWCAALLESHLSYPVLCFFRSQHDNESWLAALATILDTSVLVLIGIDGTCRHQAQMTFAIARHAVVDLTQVLGQSPNQNAADRLPRSEFDRMKSVLAEAGIPLSDEHGSWERLQELRSMYEPYLHALSNLLEMPLPQWIREGRPDNWQTSAWGRIMGKQSSPVQPERHL